MRTIILLFIIVLCCAKIQSQSKNALKQYELEMQKMMKEQEQGIKKMNSEFENYKEARQNEFNKFLKAQWKKYQVYQGKEVPNKPKPKLAPKVSPKKRPQIATPKLIEAKPIVIFPTIQTKAPQIKQPSISPITTPKDEPYEKTQLENNFDIEKIKFNFYGKELIISIDPKIKKSFDSEISNTSIAEHWNFLYKTDYSITTNQLLSCKKEIGLNDWLFYKMVDNFSKTIFKSNNNIRFLNWFILQQSGYDAKIAYKNSKLYLLLASNQEVYKLKSLKIEGTTYYLPNKPDSGIYTYKQNFEGSNKLVQFDITNEIQIPVKNKQRELSFKYKDKKYEINIAYNQNLIKLYNDYPSVDFDKYFNAQVSDITSTSIKNQFTPILKGKSKKEKAQILLSFIHEAFPYKRDDEQFGKEKYFFVEDSFYYPYCDCEDRSVLYSYLVRNLAELKTVGVSSTNHMSTGVHFNEPVGDYLEYDKKAYSICDPTYIGSKIGMKMPNTDSELEIIPNE
jgi:hypothetical protein